ncbi:heterokaryon incompatibility protein-domain-containing protein [Nemania sp. NC0429]|nr:heterokaryon incompatibility protein-domain-containing protein [Nemania sp. NC0429]
METYTYTPLDLNEPSFRLLRLFGGTGRLQCELVHAFLSPEEMMDYEAVSYTWGSAHRLASIEIHDASIKKLAISYNLSLLLRDLRHHRRNEDRMLWIDAICINQDSTVEHNHQVQQMAEIYRNAQRVIVWLGTPDHETERAMLSLTKLQILFKDMKWKASEIPTSARESFLSGEERDGDDIRLGLKRIFAHRWFRRVWILQEVGNARAALIHYGRMTLRSAIFSLAPSIFGIKIDSHCQAVLDLMPGSPANSRMRGKDLLTLLQYFREAQAAIEHDRIYALLRLCPDNGRGLIVSYGTPIPDVISKAVEHICHREIPETPRPLYSSLQDFLQHIDNFHEDVLRRLGELEDQDDLRTDVSSRHGHDTLRQTFDQQHGVIEVTETTTVRFARSRQGELLLYLLLQTSRKIAITEATLLAAAENEHAGEEILGLILPTAEKSIITEKVIEAAAANLAQGKAILELVLPKAETSIITEKAIVAAAANWAQGKAIFELILSKAETSIITEKAIVAAAAEGKAVLELILSKANTSIITEKAIVAAAKQVHKKGILGLIFSCLSKCQRT